MNAGELDETTRAALARALAAEAAARVAPPPRPEAGSAAPGVRAAGPRAFSVPVVRGLLASGRALAVAASAGGALVVVLVALLVVRSGGATGPARSPVWSPLPDVSDLMSSVVVSVPPPVATTLAPSTARPTPVSSPRPAGAAGGRPRATHRIWTPTAPRSTRRPSASASAPSRAPSPTAPVTGAASPTASPSSGSPTLTPAGSRAATSGHDGT